MAGNPMLRRLSVRARAWGSPCSCGSEEQPAQALIWNCTGSFLELREVVGGGGSGSTDASHSSLGRELAPLTTAEMLLSTTSA